MLDITVQDTVKAHKHAATEIRSRTPLASYTSKQHIDDLAVFYMLFSCLSRLNWAPPSLLIKMEVPRLH